MKVKTQPDDLPENARNCEFLAGGAAYKRQNTQPIPAQSSLERVEMEMEMPGSDCSSSGGAVSASASPSASASLI